MAIELFGAGIAPYAAIACVVSFLMSGHRSVYPSQILSIQKSLSIEVETGRRLAKFKALETATGSTCRRKFWRIAGRDSVAANPSPGQRGQAFLINVKNSGSRSVDFVSR